MYHDTAYLTSRHNRLQVIRNEIALSQQVSHIRTALQATEFKGYYSAKLSALYREHYYPSTMLLPLISLSHSATFTIIK